MSIEIEYLGGPQIKELALTDEQILDAVEGGLIAAGRGDTVIEPRMHLAPGRSDGHFNVLRGVIGDYAGVKVVGDVSFTNKSKETKWIAGGTYQDEKIEL